MYNIVTKFCEKNQLLLININSPTLISFSSTDVNIFTYQPCIKNIDRFIIPTNRHQGEYCMALQLKMMITILYQYTWKTLISFSSPLRLISKPLSSARVPSSLKTAYRFLIKIPSSLEAGRIIAYTKSKPCKQFTYSKS